MLTHSNSKTIEEFLQFYFCFHKLELLVDIGEF